MRLTPHRDGHFYSINPIRMDPWKSERWLPGVLSKSQTKRLIDEGYLEGVQENSVGFSSFDLHLSDEGYQLIKGSIKPVGNDYYKFLKDTEISTKLLPKDEAFLLERGKCYVFKLQEKLRGINHAVKIYGQATAKSTIGRLDIIARLIVDGMKEYECFTPDSIDKSGNMFLEIIPLTFNIKVSKGASLSQLRLFYGKPNESELNGQGYYESLLINDKVPNTDGTLSVDLTHVEIYNGNKAAAFRAIKNADFIDLSGKVKVKPHQFWTLETAEEHSGNHHIIIKQNEFYILRSKEKIYLPENVAVYCRAMDENLGEMRIHYAGFVHPFFGTDENDNPVGTPLIFEVRGHNVDVYLSDSEKLARLIFYRMSRKAKSDDDEKSYNDQTLKLSKHFSDWV
jgi:dCTP deaminase